MKLGLLVHSLQTNLALTKFSNVFINSSKNLDFKNYNFLKQNNLKKLTNCLL